MKLYELLNVTLNIKRNGFMEKENELKPEQIFKALVNEDIINTTLNEKDKEQLLQNILEAVNDKNE